MRLFFALWPDAAAAAALAELAVVLATPLQGKAVPAQKIHLTLAFLGEVAEDRLAAAIAAGDTAHGAEFALALDHVGAFRRARVAWAASRAVPPALGELHASLRSAILQHGLPVEERRFAPHMTLVRRIARPLERTVLPQAIGFEARGFSLMRTQPGSGSYSTLAEWDLGGFVGM
jgi:2'-5' RNA ligase